MLRHLLLGLEAERESQAENSEVLQLAQELCGQFNLEGLSPGELLWQEVYSRSRYSQDKYGNPIGPRVTPDYPIFFKGSLILNPILRGMLSVEEWRPLLASSIIYYGRLKSTVNRRSAILFIPTLALLALFLVDILLHGLIISIAWQVFTLVGLIVASTVLGAYSSLLVSRKTMLQADKLVTEQLGVASLLDTLRKIQSIRDRDENEKPMTTWGWTGYGDAPSIEKRIRNLQNG